MMDLEKMLNAWDEADSELQKEIDELKEENKELKEDLAAITMLLEMEDET